MFAQKVTQMMTPTPQHPVPCARLTPLPPVMHPCRTPVAFVRLIIMMQSRAPMCNAMRAPPILQASCSARRLVTAIVNLALSMSTKNARLPTMKRLYLRQMLISCLNVKSARFALEARIAQGHVVAPSTSAASPAPQMPQQSLVDPKVWMNAGANKAFITKTRQQRVEPLCARP